MSSLSVVPASWRTAADFVGGHHRHLRPPVGHKFSIGCADGETLVGVVIVSRPVARPFDNGQTLEVTRLATDGTANACSMLYGAAWRAAKALGYTRLITYTRSDEPGSSLRAAGWSVIAERPPRSGWTSVARPRPDRGADGIARTLWEAS